MIKRLFRPRYGTHFHVTPQRWWRPKDRKAAKTTAAVLDHDWEHGGKERMQGAVIKMAQGTFIKWPS